MPKPPAAIQSDKVASIQELKKFFDSSYEDVASLKPKPTEKKKKS